MINIGDRVRVRLTGEGTLLRAVRHLYGEMAGEVTDVYGETDGRYLLQVTFPDGVVTTFTDDQVEVVEDR